MLRYYKITTVDNIPMYKIVNTNDTCYSVNRKVDAIGNVHYIKYAVQEGIVYNDILDKYDESNLIFISFDREEIIGKDIKDIIKKISKIKKYK